jgi:hypothetical protein
MLVLGIREPNESTDFCETASFHGGLQMAARRLMLHHGVGVL